MVRRGAAFSGLTGIIGMNLSVRGNVRTAAAALDGQLPPALKVAFRTGGVTGLFCVGLGMIGAAGITLIFQNSATAVLIGFAFTQLRRLSAFYEFTVLESDAGLEACELIREGLTARRDRERRLAKAGARDQCADEVDDVAMC